MSDDIRGLLSIFGNVQRISNGFVEDVFTRNGTTGHMTVSYSAPELGAGNSIQNIRLNVSRSTVILNSLGQSMCLCDVRPGMWVDSVFSSRMTRSIPPQSNAFLIIVRRETPSPVEITTGRIARVDAQNNFIYTGNPRNINTQIRFALTPATPITDRQGNSIPFRSLRPGQMVRITHSNVQTPSIPPQTTAFHVQLL